MLSAATRAAAGVVGKLVAAISGAGFMREDGLMQGTFIGASTGALASLELADTLAMIWILDDCSKDTRIRSTRLLLRNLTAGSLPSGSVFSTIRRAVDSEMEALHQRLPHYTRQGDLFEPNFPVHVRQRAAVESLPATTITNETAGAWQQTTCPICLDEFKAGERVRWLPACCHVFHLACIDSWLLSNFHCPMCRHAVY